MIRSVLRLVLAVPGALIGLALLAPVVLLAVPFWLVALWTRGFARLLEPRAVVWQRLIAYEPEIGWRARPGLDTHAHGADVYHVKTDGQGWRGRHALSGSHVVVVGDSFAFGHGVDDERMYANVETGVRVKSVGANGYNMVQGLLWLERLERQLRGKLVVWLVYYGNDLYENLRPNLQRYRMPFVRRTEEGGWEVVTEHVSPAAWPEAGKRRYHERLAELCTESALAARAYSACEYVLGRGLEACVRAGAQLAVVGVPDVTQLEGPRLSRLAALAPDPATFDPNLPDRRIGEFCERRGVPFISLANHLSAGHYQQHDPHWTVEGHRRVARILAELYRSCQPALARGARVARPAAPVAGD